MGFTRFTGPVYGAKSLLWAVESKDVANATTVNTITSIVVPPGQDWYVTDFHVHRGSTHSTAFVASITDDSSAVATVAITSSAADILGSTQPTPTAGEREGVQILSGSTVALTVHNGGSSVASSNIHAWAYGYIRFVDSSRVGF